MHMMMRYIHNTLSKSNMYRCQNTGDTTARVAYTAEKYIKTGRLGPFLLLCCLYIMTLKLNITWFCLFVLCVSFKKSLNLSYLQIVGLLLGWYSHLWVGLKMVFSWFGRAERLMLKYIMLALWEPEEEFFFSVFFLFSVWCW